MSLTSCGEETETVSAATTSALPPGKTFVIDLTHKDFLGKGTVYKFGDASTDLGRVTIRTAAGVKTFADLLKGTDTRIGRRSGASPVIAFPTLRQAVRKLATGATAL